MSKKPTYEELIQKINEFENKIAGYSHFFDNFSEVFFQVDIDGKIIEISQSVKRYLGFTREELIGQSISILYYNQQDRKKVREKLFQTGEFIDHEVSLKSKDNRLMYGSLSGLLLYDTDGKPVGAKGLLRNITGRKLAEIALKESEERFRALSEGSPLPAFIWRKKGNDFELMQYNKAAIKITGGEVDKYIGKTASELYQDREYLLHDFHQCFIEKKAIKREVISQHFMPKKIIIASFAFIPPEFVLVSVEDITERKQAEEELRESEERYRTLFENARDGIALADADTGMLVDCNQALCSMVGRGKAELVGHHQSIIHAPQDLVEGESKTFREHRLDAQSHANEDTLLTKDGKTIFVEINGTPIRLGGHNYILGIFRDISERKHAEEILRESESNYRRLFENSVMGISQALPDGRIIGANAAYARMHGYATPEQLLAEVTHVGRQIYANPEERKETLRILKEKGVMEPREIEVVRRDGSRFWVLASAREIHDAEGNLLCYQAEHVDITKHKHTQEQMRASEEKYRTLVENLPISVSLISPNFEILAINNELKRRFPTLDVSKRPRCYQFFHTPPKDGVCPGCPTIKTFQDGNVHEFIQNEGVGDEMNYVRLISSPVKDHKGEVVAAIHVMEDITERMVSEAYIQDLSLQLLNAQENERQTLSRELHDSVAQDLSSVKIALGTLFDKESVIPDEIRQKISSSSQMVQRTISTVRNLAYDLRPPELTELGLIRTLSTYCEEFAKNTGINVKFHSAGIQKGMLDSFIEINVYRLFQECLNNARKHAEARQVTIRMVAAYPNIILRIEDDGKGFDVKEQEHASDRERQIGLQSMKERATLLRGKITVQSSPMKGTKIVIKFPVKEEKSG